MLRKAITFLLIFVLEFQLKIFTKKEYFDISVILYYGIIYFLNANGKIITRQLM